jgi:hypothetical protein
VGRLTVVVVAGSTLLVPGLSSADDAPSSEYFVATTGQGLGIAVDLTARDTTSDHLRAVLPAVSEQYVATVALVNRTSRGARLPVLFAASESGRVVAMRSPTRLLRGGGRRWWQGQRREPLIGVDLPRRRPTRWRARRHDPRMGRWSSRCDHGTRGEVARATYRSARSRATGGTCRNMTP